jgi:hypothetical protein
MPHAIALVAVSCTVAVALLGGLALGQQEPPVTVPLFDREASNPKSAGLARLADAINQAKVPRQCPLGTLTIVTAQGDPLFQRALARARRDNALQALERRGLNVAGRLAVELKPGKPDGEARYEAAGDDKPPTLTTTSTPAKGSQVKAGDRIVVRMTARDDADEWQTGIKTIQLVADSENGRFIASENYEPCSEPPEKRVEGSYTVPADPPPIVRLSAIAEDHAGLIATDTAAFPTGDWDWYGQLELQATAPTMKQTMQLDVALDYDGKGNVTGRMSGRSVQAETGGYECPFTSTPARMTAKLVGQYTPGRNAMSLSITDRNVVTGTWECVPPVRYVGRQHFVGKHGHGMINQPVLDRLLRNLTTKDDGSVEASAQDDSLSAQGITISARLDLQRSKD